MALRCDSTYSGLSWAFACHQSTLQNVLDICPFGSCLPMCQNSHYSCLVRHSWAPLPRANRVGHQAKNKSLINKHPHQPVVMLGPNLVAQTAQAEKQNKMHRWASILTAIMFIWKPFPQTVMWALGVIEQHLGRPWRFIPRGSSATDIKINRHHRGRCTDAVPHSLTRVLLQLHFYRVI